MNETGGQHGVNEGRWSFENRQNGFQHHADLWLTPELVEDAVVLDDSDLDGEEQLRAYVHHIKRRHPEWIDRDAVPIRWGVYSDGECAPFSHLWDNPIGEDFLTHFTWPYDAATGEKLDWFQLPVRMDRYPAFAEALAWTPSPFQGHCPLRSIMESRHGHLNHEARQHLRDMA